MKIHEYQAKTILARYGVPVPRGEVAFSAQEAGEIARRLGGGVSVVKAQIHAGGRGKAGGIKVVRSLEEVERVAKDLLGRTLITYQTAAAGQKVGRLLVEEGLNIDRELYLSMVVDRGSQRLVVMVSAEGGVDIEEVAARTPERIHKEYVDPAVGLMPFQARKLAFALGLSDAQVGKASKVFLALYKAFTASDASLIEINPLIATKSGDLLALDAKMNFDDNGLFRQKDVQELRDEDEEDPAEIEAGKHGLNYIKLDGNIGCLVNGAGLAMATMDIIKLYGGAPANFLDVGGGATKERVTAAFKLILSDPNVEGILVNIFGGIMRCDVIAEGVVAAAREISLQVPLVVRLEGTNVELGKKILRESELAILSADNLADAAQKVVKAVREAA
jgi:succinyl-CoA synthetase beta subunit